MNKTDLVKKVAAKQHMTQSDTADILNCFIKEIEESLSSGEDVSFAGFGSFVVNHVEERQVRNPLTGKMMISSAKNAVKFKPSKNLKEIINK